MYKNSFKNKNYYLFIYFFHIKIYQNLETTSANNSSSSSNSSSSIINNNNTSDFSPDYRRQMIQLKVLYYMHHWRQAIKTNEWVLKSFNYYHQWCFLFCYSLNFFPFFFVLNFSRKIKPSVFHFLSNRQFFFLLNFAKIIAYPVKKKKSCL